MPPAAEVRIRTKDVSNSPTRLPGTPASTVHQLTDATCEGPLAAGPLQRSPLHMTDSAPLVVRSCACRAALRGDLESWW